MIPAPTLADVLRRAEIYGNSHPLRDRLVSILFANPASLVISDLKRNRVFWDELTGESWDLFFAGYYQWGSHGDRNPIRLTLDESTHDYWMFSPRQFHEFLREVEHEVRRNGPWRFSGNADVVSFMVYDGSADWKSLKAIELCGPGAPEGAPTLGRVVEGLRRWQAEEPHSQFAPGEFELGPSVSREALWPALKWAAGLAAAGIIGNRADSILEHLLR